LPAPFPHPGNKPMAEMRQTHETTRPVVPGRGYCVGHGSM
jgi:hypothetical protein